MRSNKANDEGSGLLRSRRRSFFNSTLLRRAACVMGLLSCASTIAHAQDDDLLHYDPPLVDTIYPLLPGEKDGASTSSEDQDANQTRDQNQTAPAVDLRVPKEAVGDAATEPPLEEAFGARARVVRKQRGPVEMPGQTARDVAGAFGDPLRIVDTLPGVIPIASGIPYVYVRGAPPAAQGYVYDGIPLPQLFHGAFGPAVIHPRSTGPMKFYAGIAPTMYGRRAGGLLLAEGPTTSGTFHVEGELRLFDANAWVEAPLGGGTVIASGRLGYPKLALLASEALGVIEPGTSFSYWDGQLRYRRPVTRRDTLELVWLGSFDTVNLPGIADEDQVRAGSTRLAFHRVETRLIHQIDRGEVTAALRFGYDGSAIADAVSVRAFSVGPRVWSRIRLGSGHTLRMGGDLFASTGDVVQNSGTLGSPEGNIQVSLPQIAEASARSQGGVFSEASLKTSARTFLDLGLRFDYWSVQSNIDVAVDPRVRFTYEATDRFSTHVAFGTAHQPAVFLLPLPGLAEIAVSRGLTRSIQSEFGVGYDLPESLRIEAQAFLHQYDRLLLPELVQDAALGEDPPLSSAIAYGTEWLLKRDPSETVSGWISYTLGFANADSGPDVIGKFKPDFDVRHVINTVLQVRLPRGFVVSTRAHARSGRLVEQLNPRYEQRLPWFFRADARFGYGWDGRWAKMLAYVEWLNVTLAREYLDADCFFGQCTAQSAPPLALPNIGIRAEL